MPEHRREGLVLAVAVGIVGITFGVLADAAGLSLAQIVVLSALVFTGASQFAVVSVLDSGGSSYAAVGSALLLAARNSLYGPVVSRLVGRTTPRKIAGSQFVIDETSGMASVQPDENTARDAFWWTAVWLWSLWNLGTVGGVALGSFIGEPETFGLDAAFPAAFLSLLLPHIRKRSGVVAAFVGAALAVVFIPIGPAGVPLLVAALAVLPARWVELRGER